MGLKNTVNAYSNTIEYVNIVIFINFQDNSFGNFNFEQGNEFYDKLNGTNGTSSLYDYYNEISNNKYTFNSEVLYDDYDKVFCYTAPNNAQYYNVTLPSIKYPRQALLIYDALFEAKEYINTTITDIDNDNFVDSVMFVLCGQAVQNSILWSQKQNFSELFSYLPETIENVDYSFGFSQNSNTAFLNNFTMHVQDKFTVGTICHEQAHILGAYDLYHGVGDSVPVGNWDIMQTQTDIPQYPLSYTRKQINALDDSQITEITDSGSYTLKSVTELKEDTSSTVAYKIKTRYFYNGNYIDEWIYIEYRDHSGTNSKYDTMLEQSGLIVYRVQPDIQTGNVNARYNNVSFPDQVYVYSPGVSNLENLSLRTRENLRYSALSLNNTLPNNNIYDALGSVNNNLSYNSNCIFSSNGENTKICISIEQEENGEITFFVVAPNENITVTCDEVQTLFIDDIDSLNLSYNTTIGSDCWQINANNSNVEILENLILKLNNIGQSNIQIKNKILGVDISCQTNILDYIKFVNVNSNPTKTTYNYGETANVIEGKLAGVELQLVYASGRIEVMDLYTTYITNFNTNIDSGGELISSEYIKLNSFLNTYIVTSNIEISIPNTPNKPEKTLIIPIYVKYIKTETSTSCNVFFYIIIVLILLVLFTIIYVIFYKKHHKKNIHYNI
ncbi:MAG: hypothetical protein WC942_00025 [Clostridia bacterium]|jgi:M6 family metalloprotease-like protein